MKENNSILIVDDQSTNREAYRLTINDMGIFNVVDTARDEIEAIDLIEKSNYDIVLTDMILNNDEGGIIILEKAKQKDPWCMVIVVTAHAKKIQRYEAFKKGAFDCISKGAVGIKTSDEIIAKCKAALYFREIGINQINKETKFNKLKRYFDPKVFEILNNDPTILAPSNKLVTIVFWDIRGFSKFSETLKAHPDLIANFLKEYCEEAATSIFNNNGVLDKFIGDGVMALFGALDNDSSRSNEHVCNAIKSAFELRENFNKLLKSWIKRWELYTPEKIDIGLGCGIHTGTAIVGNIGTDLRDDFTAIGPSVNLASRVESKSAKDQILISAQSKAHLKNSYNTKEVGLIDNIKNIPGEYFLYEVID